MRRINAARRRLRRPKQAGMNQNSAAGGFFFSALSQPPSFGTTDDKCVLTKQADDTVPEADDTVPEADDILRTPDETSDVILDVEGREFHTNRAVLAHYSPVFRKMLFSDFKEKDEQRVPLPGKEVKSMEMFFKVLFPRDATSQCPVSDDNLIAVLTLADEYQVDQVKVMCQNYIGEQLAVYFYNFYKYYTTTCISQNQRNQGYCDKLPTFDAEIAKRYMSGQILTKSSLIDKLTMYLWACDQYTLPTHRSTIMSVLVALIDNLTDLRKDRPHYTSLPASTRIELLENVCIKFRPAP